METKILIINDSIDDYAFVESSLFDSGIQAQIIYAPDGITGCMEAAKEDIDCIFLDYHLPKMNGMEVLKQIRSDGIDIPIIMLTGQKDDHTIVELLKEGANDFISKSDITSKMLRLSFENSRQLYKMQKEKEAALIALTETQLRLSEAQEIAGLGNWEYDCQTKELYLSEHAQKIMDYPNEKSIFPIHAFIRHHVYPDNIGMLLSFIRDLKKYRNYSITLRIKTFENNYKYVQLKKRGEGNFITDDNKIIGTIQDVTVLKNALEETRKSKISRKATTNILAIGICFFLASAAIIDPLVNAFQISILMVIAFKAFMVFLLKPLETLLEKVMQRKVSTKKHSY